MRGQDKIFKGRRRADGNLDYSNIVNDNYLIIGLHKQEIFDNKGDLITLNLYRNYNADTKVFSNLAIQENRAYTRDSVTGIPNKRETNITWYDEDGITSLISKDSVIKHYSVAKGYKANKRARQNLVDKAAMTLFSMLIANDPINAEANVDDFSSLLTLDMSKYIKSNIDPLITAITNSTDVSKPEYRLYITADIRDTLLSILNIQYA